MKTQNQKFNEDLEFGKKAENLFCNAMYSLYYCNYEKAPDTYHPAWDVSITGNPKEKYQTLFNLDETSSASTFEVKFVRNSVKNSNVVVLEIEKIEDGYGLASGINLSQATNYAFLFQDEYENEYDFNFHLIKRIDLLKLLEKSGKYYVYNGWGCMAINKELLKDNSKKMMAQTYWK